MVSLSTSIYTLKNQLTFLDLSYNKMDNPKYQKKFICRIRNLICFGRLFHLNLSGMNLGKSICDLAEAIKTSENLCGVHLSDNGKLSPEVLYFLDKTLNIPRSQQTKVGEVISQFFVKKFKPPGEEKEAMLSSEDSEEYHSEKLEKGKPVNKLTSAVVGKLLSKALGIDLRLAKLQEYPLVYTNLEKHPEFRFTT